MKNNVSKFETRDIAYIALFAAVMSVLSQISLPLPGGVPVTLQTFGAALVGYMLGAKKGAVSMAVYMLLGAAGAPVFAGFHGGFGSVVGQSGGFIWGFIPMAFLCGAGTTAGKWLASGKPEGYRRVWFSHSAAIALGVLGMAACHICGILQWSAINGGGFWSSFWAVSAPFLIKDVLSVGAAYFACEAVGKRIYLGSKNSRQV